MNMTVKEHLKLSKERWTDGMYGVEIEVEGRNLPQEVRLWRLDGDGSLRGEESIEYVLRKPQTLAKVREALNNLDKKYIQCESRVDESVRAGVHVHINMQDSSYTELFTMMTLYLSLEQLMVEWCGDSRVGNHFCLRSSDAEYVIYIIRECLAHNTLNYMNDENLRYSSMNVMALHKYGSLEFRSMRGTRDLDLIYKWVCMLGEMKRSVKKFANPQDVMEVYSTQDVDEFLDKVLGKWSGELTALPDYKAKVLDGVRQAQDIAYAVSWEEVEESFGKMKLKPKRHRYKPAEAADLVVPPDWNINVEPKPEAVIGGVDAEQAAMLKAHHERLNDWVKENQPPKVKAVRPDDEFDEDFMAVEDIEGVDIE